MGGLGERNFTQSNRASAMVYDQPMHQGSQFVKAGPYRPQLM